ncbi:DUF4079 domain-containing protein [Leptolyngbya ohadii]|uniref:DUF4079 domain-containing protein n=1 Tax=Leptolyngbya ohadii TaxID=1962290 RepID=UPI000B59CE93|nr:DUF4079 domain-containing protein [Leptolyngbya ohadii]
MLEQFAARLSELLEPIAAFFRDLNVPEPIVHWGHPVMMGIVVLVMGSYAVYAGWKGRLATDPEVAAKNWMDHKKIAPLMFLFIAMGYTGGVLSLVMQKQPILGSTHFWTGSIALLLLTLNGLFIALSFGKAKGVLRTAHAYLGSVAFVLLLLHGVFGLKLGLSI